MVNGLLNQNILGAGGKMGTWEKGIKGSLDGIV